MLKVRYEIAFTWASLGVVLGSFGFYLQTAHAAEAGWHSRETLVFVIVVALLISGNLVYHFSRLGYLHRRRTHRAASRDILEAIYDSLPLSMKPDILLTRFAVVTSTVALALGFAS